MKKNRKIILIFLMILLCILICIISFLIWKLNNSEISQEEYHHHELETEIGEDEYTKKIVEVNNRDRYFAVKNILNIYITYIKQMNGIIGFQKYNDEEVIDGGIDLLYDILDENYKIDSNVTKEKLQNIIPSYSDYELQINEMYSFEKADAITIYFVYGKIDKKDFKLLIKTDSVNMTFSIFLEDYMEKNNYSEKMNVNDINISDRQISKNDNNQYRYTNISDGYMISQYMHSLKYNIINNTEYTYNNLIKEEYKEKRFKTLQNFINYVEENKNKIDNIEPKKYTINEYEDYKEYICIDQNNNYYIFKEIAIMNYKVQLDTYTIDSNEFIEKYNKSSDEVKVGMNIEKMLEAINHQDYEYVYNKLNETFKKNNFSDINKFENYIKSNFFDNSDIEYVKYSTEGNTYIYNVNIKNTENKLNINNLNIIMKLNEETNFEISFGI